MTWRAFNQFTVRSALKRDGVEHMNDAVRLQHIHQREQGLQLKARCDAIGLISSRFQAMQTGVWAMRAGER